MSTAAGSAIFTSARIGRQTFFVASVMVLTGLALGVFVNPWWLLLALMPGIGMMITALTAFCPMSWILAHMPWNRATATCCHGAANSVVGDA